MILVGKISVGKYWFQVHPNVVCITLQQGFFVIFKIGIITKNFL